MKKQVSLFGIAVLPLLLTSCGTSAVRGSNNNIYYHGYSTDLNHDGVISDDEQHLTWAQSYDVLINEIKTMAIDTSEELNERFRLHAPGRRPSHVDRRDLPALLVHR
jgi:hypothetical protein